jgi:hypothetical protein
VSNFQLDGVDYSANPPSLSGKTLFQTIPANKSRRGFFIQNQDATGTVYAVFDDQAGSLTQSIIALGPGTSGLQGGSVTMGGMPHTGRIRIYGDAGTTKIGARVW